MIEQKVF